MIGRLLESDKRLQGDRIGITEETGTKSGCCGDSEYQKGTARTSANVEHRVLRKYHHKVSGHELEHDVGEQAIIKIMR